MDPKVLEPQRQEALLFEEAIKQTQRHEGFRAYPYRCPAGKLTIGYGRNIEDNGITTDEAKTLLANDLEKAILELRLEFPTYSTFTFKQKLALIDMMFNLGRPKFLEFKKMISAIKLRNWEKAAYEAQNSKWYNQVGARGVYIVKLLKGENI